MKVAPVSRKNKNKPNTKTSTKKSKGWKNKGRGKLPDKRGRLVIRNLSFKATEENVKELFKKCGEVSEVKLLRRPDGNLVGCGFVQFCHRDNAAKAIKACNGQNIFGRELQVDWAKPQAAYITDDIHKQVEIKEEPNEPNTYDVPAKSGKSEGGSFKNGTDYEIVEGLHVYKVEDVGLPESSTDSLLKREDKRDDTPFKKQKKKTTDREKQKKQRKKVTEEGKQKRGRLIIRNLPFKATESSIKQHFQDYGDVTEVTLLHKPDGKLVGCGFVQFAQRKSAAKAILGSSGKPFMGRTIIIDWAIPKSTYLSTVQSLAQKELANNPIKVEPVDPDNVNDTSSSGLRTEEVKSESESEVSEIKQEDESEDSESEVEGSDSEEERDIETRKHIKQEKDADRLSSDVSEGRTVFIKNVPFSVTNQDLKNCIEQFGPVVYALVCVDPLTEHSKGSAFVKFEKKESADECLQSGTELKLQGQILDVHPALNREEIQNKAQMKKEEKKNKDSRNLYLVKEGVVLAGSKAAVGVSPTDMARRLQLEQWKTQMLRNLSMLVSRQRLVIHNLPESWDDARLRKLFKTYTKATSVITEARVMRDMRNVNVDGIGKSKEYGFVTFTRHEDAMEALRNINNNPNIFSKVKRPIVAFSIENKKILNLKHRRLLKSRMKNPQHANNAAVEKKLNTQQNCQEETGEDSGKAFTGVIAAPGNVKMRSRHKLKAQAALHNKVVKKAKQKQKMTIKITQNKQNSRRIQEPQAKEGRRRRYKDNDEEFSNLVNKYKTKLVTASLKKWYE